MRAPIALICIALAINCHAQAFGAARPADSNTIRREIKAILSTPEYNRVYSSEQRPGWAKRIGERLAEWIRGFVEKLRLEPGTAGRTASIIFAGLVLLVTGMLIALLLRGVKRGSQHRSDSPSAVTPVWGLGSAAGLVSQAESHARAGEWREAYRKMFLASIAWLDEAGVIRYRRGRTTREHIDDLRERSPAKHDMLLPVADGFDRIVYGPFDCGPADFADASSAYRGLSEESAR